MKNLKSLFSFGFLVLITQQFVFSQNAKLVLAAKEAMENATKYMVEEVSTNGGYVSIYLPDLSRRWGELEAFETQVWVQSPGTVSMGSLFLDAYHVTGNEYYYQAAERVAKALVWGQLPSGGWNYIIDFSGDRSLKEWYNTIGKNAWGFEEYNHYYGNATFDDVNTSDAAKLLLRTYLRKLDPKYKPALDKAIAFVLESQYPLGGWPQRYPLKHDYSHGEFEDYTSFYTFNDDVISGNIEFLIDCYTTLGEERLLDPIIRGMYFYLVSQQGKPQAGWGQQYNMELQPAHARTYEPPALLPGTTYTNAMLLIRFYEYTKDRKFLSRVPDAIKWLEDSRLPEQQTEGGKYTH
jgi:PelA/Pel-15E family pectate lyase